jgi:hypothetical protein
MKQPHKHAELIKAWVDGAEIQFYDQRFNEHRWKDCGVDPYWASDVQFRVKPELKPDVVVYPETATSWDEAKKNQWYVKGKLKLTFDGETGKLKSAEVI